MQNAHLSDLNLAGLATIALLAAIPIVAASVERRQMQRECRRQQRQLDQLWLEEAHRIVAEQEEVSRQ